MIYAFLIVAGQAAGLVKPDEGKLDRWSEAGTGEANPTLAHELEARGVIAAKRDLQIQLAKGTELACAINVPA